MSARVCRASMPSASWGTPLPAWSTLYDRHHYSAEKERALRALAALIGIDPATRPRASERGAAPWRSRDERARTTRRTHGAATQRKSASTAGPSILAIRLTAQHR